MLYISDRVISFSLPVNGVTKRFRFEARMRGGSYYVATLDSEIKALEGSDMFGRIYKRGEEVVAPKRVRKVKMKEVAEVLSWQEAQEYLVSVHGYDAAHVQTPDAIQAAALEKCIVFPNLK